MPAPGNSPEAPAEHGLRNEDKQPKDEVESDQSHSLSDGDQDEYVVIQLSDVRKEFQCPICLGIIRKTRTIMECLHRFCRECIDKAMRLGHNECPACRTYCASQHSLRDDPNYDALISAIYPDIDKYEEEEFALNEDEIIHNNQIQASIAQTRQRQSEVLSRKQNAMARAVAFGRSQGNHRTSHLRRRRNAGELQVPIDNEDINDNDAGNDDLSSGDETKETMPEIGGVSDENEDTNDNNMEDFSSGDEKTKIGGERETQFPQESATMDEDGTGDENIPDENEYISSSGTLASSDINDECSNTQVNDNNARSSRISRLIEHLRNSDVKDEELEIHLMVVSSDEEKIPRLQEPYLCCRPCVSVKILCKYVALKSGLLAHQVELSLVQDPKINIISGEGTVDPEKDKLRVLGDEETLAELFTWNAKTCGHLLLAYKMK